MGKVQSFYFGENPYYDLTPPVIDQKAPIGVIATATPNISARVTDTDSWVEWYWVEGYFNSQPITVWTETTYGETGRVNFPLWDLAPLSNDVHTVELRIYDYAMNEAYDTWSFTVDTSFSISSMSPTSSMIVNNPTISATVTGASIDWGNLKMLIDGSPVTYSYNAMTGDVWYIPSPGLEVGGHWVVLGGVEWWFDIDAEPPEITNYYPSDGEYINVSEYGFLIEFTDNGAGIDLLESAFEFVHIGDVNSPYTPDDLDADLSVLGINVPLGSFDDGEWHCYANLVDNLGNARPEFTLHFYVDTQAPTVDYVSPYDGATVYTHAPMIFVRFFDDASGINPYGISVSVQAAGVSFAPPFVAGRNFLSFMTGELAYGTYTVSIELYDWAGNYTLETSELNIGVGAGHDNSLTVAITPSYGPLAVTWSATATYMGTPVTGSTDFYWSGGPGEGSGNTYTFPIGCESGSYNITANAIYMGHHGSDTEGIKLSRTNGEGGGGGEDDDDADTSAECEEVVPAPGTGVGYECKIGPVVRSEPGVPDSCPPTAAVTTIVTVTITNLPAGDAVQFDVVDGTGNIPAPNSRYGVAAVVGTNRLTVSGSITISGVSQTDETKTGQLFVRGTRIAGGAAGGNAGNATTDIRTSPGFTVCAHPTTVTASRKGDFSTKDKLGVTAYGDATSDSGRTADLDMIEIVEQVKQTEGTGNLNVQSDSNPQPGHRQWEDDHTKAKSAMRPLEQRTWKWEQLHVYSCKRCKAGKDGGATRIKVPNSGFEMEGDENISTFDDADDVVHEYYYFQMTKTPKGVTIGNWSVSGGAGNARSSEFDLGSKAP